MPVLVTDALVPAFAPWTAFGVVVNESDWERTREILEAVPYAERERLRRNARRVCRSAARAVPWHVQSVIDTLTLGESHIATSME